jgi:hypothetical protein
VTSTAPAMTSPPTAASTTHRRVADEHRADFDVGTDAGPVEAEEVHVREGERHRYPQPADLDPWIVQ